MRLSSLCLTSALGIFFVLTAYSISSVTSRDFVKEMTFYVTNCDENC